MMDEKFQAEIENEKSPIENNEQAPQADTFRVNIPEEATAEVPKEAQKPQIKAQTTVPTKPKAVKKAPARK